MSQWLEYEFEFGAERIHVRLFIDVHKVAARVCNRAMRSRLGKATALRGGIRAEVVKHEVTPE